MGIAQAKGPEHPLPRQHSVSTSAKSRARAQIRPRSGSQSARKPGVRRVCRFTDSGRPACPPSARPLPGPPSPGPTPPSTVPLPCVSPCLRPRLVRGGAGHLSDYSVSLLEFLTNTSNPTCLSEGHNHPLPLKYFPPPGLFLRRPEQCYGPCRRLTRNADSALPPLRPSPRAQAGLGLCCCCFPHWPEQMPFFLVFKKRIPVFTFFLN